jgi:hypothetical protein
MSTVRIQVRRGTAAQWTSVDPVLEAGEMGLESDTNYIKFGNGTDVWSELGYANDPGFLDLTNSLVNYVEVSDIGAVSGVAGLDSSKNLIVPGSSIIVEGSTANDYETTLVITDPTADRTITFPNATGTVALTSDITALIDGAPGALDTLNELAAAINDDANFVTTIFTALSGKQENVPNVGDTEIGYLFGLTSNVQTQLNNKQPKVTNVSDTEIGYLDGVSSSIQTQLDSKISTITADSTYQVKVSGVSDTEIGYLDGVTSSIQTQIDNKAPLANPTFTGIISLDSSILFEGSTADAFETNLVVVNPTADRTITLPDATGTVALTSDISTHEADTTSVHGIADTSLLATTSYADGKASDAQTNAITAAGIAAASAIGTAVTNHENDTTNVHGIADTSVLSTASNTQTLTNKTLTSPKINEDVALTATATELNYVDGVTSAIQTQLDAKALATDLSAHATDETSIHGISDTAQLAYKNAANQTFTGNMEVDGNLVVDGNLTVNGTQFNASSTSIVIEDSLVQLAHQNPANTVDLGIVVGYNDGTAKHSGFVRDVSADIWKIFKGVTTEPTTTVDFTEGSLDNLQLNNLTAAGVVFTDGTQTKEGVPSQTTIIQKTAAYTLSALTERDDLIEVSHTGGSAVDITIPTDATLNFPIGTAIDVLRTNTGGVRIVGAGGVTVNATPGAFLRAQWSSATLFKRAANTWVLIGDLATA